jgi:cytochrome c oxidase subunit II
MRSQFRAARRPATLAVGVAALLLAGCEMPIALDPRGPAAAEIARIWWIFFWTATVVSVIVFALLAVAIVRARGRTRDEELIAAHEAQRAAAERPPLADAGEVSVVERRATDARRAEVPAPPPRVRPSWLENRTTAFVLIAGGVIPTIILAVATFITLSGLRVFDRPPEGVELTVLVRGHMFWWEIEYPDHAVHDGERGPRPRRPERPLRAGIGRRHPLVLGSAVARQAGHDPGQDERPLRELQTSRASTSASARSSAASSTPTWSSSSSRNRAPSSRPGWRRRRRTPPSPPPSSPSADGRCSWGRPARSATSIRGVTTAAAEVGPDLTHLASRQHPRGPDPRPTCGATSAAWILDPQGIKPGNRMPAVNLTSEDFLALLEYLEEPAMNLGQGGVQDGRDRVSR